MGVTILGVLGFLGCWLALLVNRIIAFRVKSKLKKAIIMRFPSTVWKSSRGNGSISDFQSSGSAFINVFLSFGSFKVSEDFWNNLVDVECINNSDDEEIKRLLRSSINLTSSFVRLWVVAVVIILLSALLLKFAN